MLDISIKGSKQNILWMTRGLPFPRLLYDAYDAAAGIYLPLANHATSNAYDATEGGRVVPAPIAAFAL